MKAIIKTSIIGVFLFLFFIGLYVFGLVLDTAQKPPRSLPQTNIVNDITGLNPISVAKIIVPNSTDEIAKAVRSHNGKISIGGGRYSQGGQIAFEDSLHLDMRQFNEVLTLNEKLQTIRVQSGITWRELQEYIDPYDLSVKIMQSYSNFTVGGSLSVNVHGRYIGEGPIIRSVSSITLVLANGEVITASPDQNPELYFSAIGGYGGIGVIAEVTLELEKNTKVRRQSVTMELNNYPAYFAKQVLKDERVIFHNADIYPPNYEKMRAVSWTLTDQPVTESKRLVDKNQDYLIEPVLAELVAHHESAKWLRQYILEPALYSFDMVHWRNYEASYDVNQLEPINRDTYTYALREYFVPIDKFGTFTESMVDIFQKHNVNVLNVSVRHALPDTGSYLAWAEQEVFAFVVYYRQQTNIEGRNRVNRWSKEMIDAAISSGGTYYLPYQLHATSQQFHQAYPRANEYFAVKKVVDPHNRFSNKLLERHFPVTSMNKGAETTHD
ncbi:FAD-binding oxidoreductase [Thalassotalea litorea]|uniref:FAD-binding oxidoreductase n=1 Tax=Thalassotalea litorea TaxID=2020715 RepID=A0A5R9IR48_9GAMM|nr:FAD-binding oxidoreductase [Thalassotalea litorea]TLU65696.1 FAD-binding oxidoreductase [Thalassotalea litorea]